MPYRYFLDNILFNEPQGWDQLTSTIKRDREDNGLLRTQDAKITFIGDGYDYLRAAYDTDGFTRRVGIRIEEDTGGSWVLFYTGYIYLSDVTWDLKRATATSPVQDNSYWAQINNSKSVPVYPYVSQSRSGVTITPAPLHRIKFHKVSDGTQYSIASTPGGWENYGIRAYDLLAFLVAFMSDDAVAFHSDALDWGGEHEGYLYTTGRIVQLVDQAAVDGNGDSLFAPVDEQVWQEHWEKIAFEDVFRDLNRRFNLGYMIDYTTAKPTLRVEPVGWFRDPVVIFDAPAVDELKEKTSSEYLYSKVSFGNGNTLDERGLSFPEQINYKGFKEEEYAIIGSSSIDRTLKLTTDYICSSNAVEYLLENSTESDGSYDKAVVILECEWNGYYFETVGTNNLDSTAHKYYNQTLTNEAVAERFLGAVPNSISDFLEAGSNGLLFADNTTAGNGDGDYRAIHISGTSRWGVVSSQNESDPGNNYDNATYEYEIPSSGVYTFDTLVYVTNMNVPVCFPGVGLNYPGYAFQIYINRYDNAGIDNSGTGNLLSSHILSENLFTEIRSAKYIGGTKTIIANAGEKIVVMIRARFFGCVGDPASPANMPYLGSRTFRCIGTVSGGGVYKTYDPEDYSVIETEFTYPMTGPEYRLIEDNPRGLIQYAREGQLSRRGYLLEMKYDHRKGKAAIKLLANKKLNG